MRGIKPEQKKLLQFLEIADNTQVIRTLGGNSQGLTVTRVSSSENGSYL